MVRTIRATGGSRFAGVAVIVVSRTKYFSILSSPFTVGIKWLN